MLDFDKPPIEKSESEKKFDELNAEYTEKFGVPYVFNVGFSMTWDEALADIRKRIDTGTPQEQPDYNPDYLY